MQCFFNIRLMLNWNVGVICTGEWGLIGFCGYDVIDIGGVLL